MDLSSCSSRSAVTLRPCEVGERERLEGGEVAREARKAEEVDRAGGEMEVCDITQSPFVSERGDVGEGEAPVSEGKAREVA